MALWASVFLSFFLSVTFAPSDVSSNRTRRYGVVSVIQTLLADGVVGRMIEFPRYLYLRNCPLFGTGNFLPCSSSGGGAISVTQLTLVTALHRVSFPNSLFV